MTATFTNVSKNSESFTNVSKTTVLDPFNFLIDDTFFFLIESPFMLSLGSEGGQGGISWTNLTKT